MIDYRVQPIKPKLPIVFSWFHPHSNHKSAIFPCLNFVHLKKHPKPRERKRSMVVRGRLQCEVCGKDKEGGRRLARHSQTFRRRSLERKRAPIVCASSSSSCAKDLSCILTSLDWILHVVLPTPTCRTMCQHQESSYLNNIKGFQSADK